MLYIRNTRYNFPQISTLHNIWIHSPEGDSAIGHGGGASWNVPWNPNVSGHAPASSPKENYKKPIIFF